MYLFFYQIVLNLFSAAIPVFACTNVLLYPLKRVYKAVVFLYVFILFHFFGNQLGQSITPIAIGGLLLFIFCFTKERRFMNIGCALLGYICSVVLNYAVINLLTLMGLDLDTIVSAIPLLFTVLFFFASYGMTFGIGHVIRNYHELTRFKVPKFVGVCLFLEIVLCALIVIFNIIAGEKLGYPNQIIQMNGVFFSFFFLITFLITFFLISTYEKENAVQDKLKKYKYLQDYAKKMEDLYMDLRVFKHDYFNILSSLRAYMDADDMDGLKNYFEHSIMPESKKLDNKNKELSSLSYLGVQELKGLVYTKLFHAVNLGILVELDIKEPITQFSMDILDLTRILGIFLDNAIEAAETTKDKKVYIGFAKREENVLVVIRNSCENQQIDMKGIYQLGRSSKGEHRGVGLYQAQRILGKYKNIIHSTGYVETMFSQTLEIVGDNSRR